MTNRNFDYQGPPHVSISAAQAEDEIRSAPDTVEVARLVYELSKQFEMSSGDSYGEGADKLENMAHLLRAAEERWNELENDTCSKSH